jgi:hypothetical protein
MNTKNGRLMDVLVQNNVGGDDGEKIFGFIVYADAGLNEIIENVEGVMKSYSCYKKDIEYIVDIDPRYDREWVKQEIIAKILCKD